MKEKNKDEVINYLRELGLFDFLTKTITDDYFLLTGKKQKLSEDIFKSTKVTYFTHLCLCQNK